MRADQFESIAKSLFATKREAAAFFGVDRGTLYRWFWNETQIPRSAVLLAFLLLLKDVKPADLVTALDRYENLPAKPEAGRKREESGKKASRSAPKKKPSGTSVTAKSPHPPRPRWT